MQGHCHRRIGQHLPAVSGPLGDSGNQDLHQASEDFVSHAAHHFATSLAVVAHLGLLHQLPLRASSRAGGGLLHRHLVRCRHAQLPVHHLLLAAAVAQLDEEVRRGASANLVHVELQALDPGFLLSSQMPVVLRLLLVDGDLLEVDVDELPRSLPCLGLLPTRLPVHDAFQQVGGTARLVNQPAFALFADELEGGQVLRNNLDQLLEGVVELCWCEVRIQLPSSDFDAPVSEHLRLLLAVVPVRVALLARLRISNGTLPMMFMPIHLAPGNELLLGVLEGDLGGALLRKLGQLLLPPIVLQVGSPALWQRIEVERDRPGKFLVIRAWLNARAEWAREAEAVVIQRDVLPVRAPLLPGLLRGAGIELKTFRSLARILS
mmetsp:Transcript_57221/g.167999  ORF Transcript_57221/g.167999 Transcript_57221/m.167999 type:complete len:377 (+) Transcript_57221:417-1547(+)